MPTKAGQVVFFIGAKNTRTNEILIGSDYKGFRSVCNYDSDYVD